MAEGVVSSLNVQAFFVSGSLGVALDWMLLLGGGRLLLEQPHAKG